MMTARSSNLITFGKLLIALLLGLPLVLLLLTLQLTPSVPASRSIDDDDIRAIEQLIVDNAPKQISSIDQRRLQLNREEMNLLAAFALQTIPGLQDLSADVTLGEGSASIDLVLPWRTPVMSLYTNLHARIRQQDGALELYDVRAGHLPVPTALVRGAIRTADRQLCELSGIIHTSATG